MCLLNFGKKENLKIAYALPKTMKAAVVREFGQPLQIGR
jgi:hypothetical protein